LPEGEWRQCQACTPEESTIRIAITSLGTRGDVQPYLALAQALMARGHDVLLAAPSQFEGLAAERQVPYAPLPGEFLEILNTPQGKAAVAGGQGFSAGFKLLKYVRPLIRRLMDIEAEAIRGLRPDILVYHPKSVSAPHIAELLHVPAILASPLPGFTPTAAFPSPLLPFGSLGPLNRVSHAFAINGANFLFAKTLKEWRKTTLGLPAKPARPLRPDRTLYAYSPAVLPKPADWDEHVSVTGYWFLDKPDWQVPAPLADFLAVGPRPVYVGFGSMPGLDPHAMTEAFTAAFAATGKRAVIATGGGAMAPVENSQTIHFIEGAPHDRLLPLMDGMIHHGGAGTTAAALRAGLPMTICPFFGDQPFWARLMQTRGVAPAPLDRKNLSVKSIATALAAMDRNSVRDAARSIANAIRTERGTEVACDVIENAAGRAASPG
jgi:UDP:flavonoid glycosyltransferase YjiC (YdhE family)